MASRREEALFLADELLADIELGRIAPQDVARKTYRLARLLDDAEAMEWLQHEVNGYRVVRPANTFDADGWKAAQRSNRDSFDTDGKHTASPTLLGQLQADIEAGKLQFAAAADPSVSLQSANQYQLVEAPKGNMVERRSIRQFISQQQALLDRMVGAMHAYVAARHQELRFGAAVETAFGVVRAEVDELIARLVPEAPDKLAAAFENAASDNPEQWANAAGTCRRLLKAAADALRPPGPDVNGRKMRDEHYINRLVNWIEAQADSETAANLIIADLAYLGRRLDAANVGGHKGAHAEVDRFDASRFVTGTYLALGDILRLRAKAPVVVASGAAAAEASVASASGVAAETETSANSDA